MADLERKETRVAAEPDDATAERNEPEGAAERALVDRLARVSADFDNYKKRVRREQADALRYANEDIARDLLTVVDNLQRAAEAGRRAREAPGMVRGVELVLRQLEDVLARYGVVEIDALGERFDPTRHEAVALRAAPGAPPSTVVEELQRGYQLHERLLRPARVAVSSDDPDDDAGPH